MWCLLHPDDCMVDCHGRIKLNTLVPTAKARNFLPIPYQFTPTMTSCSNPDLKQLILSTRLLCLINQSSHAYKPDTDCLVRQLMQLVICTVRCDRLGLHCIQDPEACLRIATELDLGNTRWNGYGKPRTVARGKQRQDNASPANEEMNVRLFACQLSSHRLCHMC